MLNGLDLFSGIGGLTIALAPWVRPVAYCENDRYAQSVLLSRMADGSLPLAPIWDDITSLTGAMLPATPDIIYGGFPCQDISCAGPGIGLGGKRSGLYWELYRLVQEIRPKWVFLENVPAIRTRGSLAIVRSLATLGYDCRWTVVSAAELGAPHKRARWFLLANAMCEGLPESGCLDPKTRAWQGWAASQRRLQEQVWQKTDGELCGMDDGLRPATQRIKGLGNAVVPLQAREAFMRLSGLRNDHA